MPTESKALQYARFCVNKNNKNVPKYVKKQARKFIAIATGKDKKYVLNDKTVTQIEKITKLLIMPSGLKAGQTLYESNSGYQWLMITAALAVVYRSDQKKRRYETVVLEIGRKNYKTFTVAEIFIILFLLEPRFSNFFSVAPDGTLSREIKKAITEILKQSPLMYYHNGHTRFNILRDSITLLLNDNTYIPLNYSTSRLDSRLPSAFLADEVGALPNSYAIEAMRSGQVGIKNKLGFIISTKYPTVNNPFEDEILYAKNVLDGIVEDEAVFSLLYEPDAPKKWMTDDKVIYQANPAAIDSKVLFDNLVKKRKRAIIMPSARENFLTKHCNIIYQGAGTESYIDVNDLLKCRVDTLDWQGKTVYVGVDLAISNDNCGVVMIAEDDDGNLMIHPMCFIPEDRIEEKSQFERCDYRQYINAGQCIACGGRTVDYSVIEDYVEDAGHTEGLEARFGVHMNAIGYDRFNAISSAQKWEEREKNTVQIRQHSDTLHPPTKLLYELISNAKVKYIANPLYEANFQNSKCTFDTNKNRYVNKKKSNGKVDLVVATLNALYLLQQDSFIGGAPIVQVI